MQAWRQAGGQTVKGDGPREDTASLNLKLGRVGLIFSCTSANNVVNVRSEN